MPSTATQLGMFVKHWTPGRVKTRLAEVIGEPAAAKLYRAFVETLLARLTGLAERNVVYFSPPTAQAELAAILPAGWQLAPQAEGDLGQRMQCYFDEAFSAGVQRAVLIGSDTPDLPLAYVRQSFEALREVAVVLGPSEDGGYYLVGGSQQVPPIFDDITWSTADVWPQTVQRLAQANLHEPEGYRTTPVWHDVDDVAQLKQLHTRLGDQPACGDARLARLYVAVDEALS